MIFRIKIIITISLLFINCKESPKEKSYLKTEVVAPKIPVKKARVIKSKILDIPFYQKIQLSNSKQDSLKIFKGGDCGGSITRFRFDKKTLTIDTTSCGDYGDTYTNYILDSLNSIQIVFKEELNHIKNGMIKKQLLINFSDVPVVAKSKIDTIYSNGNKELKLFKNDTLIDVLTSYEHWTMHYDDIWSLEDVTD